jgi:putative Mg2+ transporter-C (MgtC) family protein
MVWVSKLEDWLPSRSQVAVAVQFKSGFHPQEEALCRVALERGYEIAGGSLSVTFREEKPECHFLAVARDKKRQVASPTLIRYVDALTRPATCR